MKIYTRKGDGGETSIIGGRVVAKDDARIEATGKVDELNSVIGIVIAFSEDPELREKLLKIQRTLFVLGSDLATPLGEKIAIPRLSPQKASELEEMIDAIDAGLPKITSFVLPGGSKTASLMHLARVICREAERKVVALKRQEGVNDAIPIYLNRLSDLLFMFARSINYKKKVPETLWR
ncbi:MAG: cob(I)yrinic acid a,c-diamide adenosyltransferase [Candidatus ainarchaeum sp.]|nr:cob(I)yrinic acid a,c-diamide adenosyltransferase [Candidatus ainarchaeum sp.]